MIHLAQYFKRSTIILLIILVAVIVTVIWANQYLAIRNTAVATLSPNPALISAPITQDLPVQALVTEQVFKLKATPKTSYAMQAHQRSSGGVFVPGLPAITVVDAQVGNRVLISWYSQVDQLSFDGVMIYRATTPDATGELVTTVATTTSGNYLDTTVTTDQTYYYVVQTYRNNTATNEPVTSKLSTVYAVTVTDQFAPASPQAVTVSVAETDAMTLIVSWENVSNDGVVENRIYRSTTAGIVGELVATVPATTTTVGQWTDTTVQPDTVYYYTVSAVDLAANESTVNLPIAPAGNPNPFGALNFTPVSDTAVTTQ